MQYSNILHWSFILLTCLSYFPKLRAATDIASLSWKVGQTQTLISCASTVDSAVVWRKNSQILPVTSSDSSLHFRPVKFDDSGLYECISQSAIYAYSVTVQDIPTPPGQLKVTNITSRSFTLNWDSSNPNGAPIRYYLVLVTQNNKGHLAATDQSRRIRSPDNGTSFVVTNLVPFAYHTVQVIAVNDVGHSRPSAVSPAILTKSEPPSSPPVLIMAESLTSSTIRLQWLPPGREMWHGPLRGYRLSYRPENDVHTTEIIIDNPQIQAYEIRRLQPFRRYYISLQAFNDDGYSPGQTAVIRTVEAAPAAPYHLKTDGLVQSDSFTISWKPPLITNGIIKSYKVYCTHPAGFTDSAVVVMPEATDAVNSADYSYELIGLTPYSAYHVRVTALTSVAEGPPTDTLTVMTDVAPPSQPDLINASRVAENAIIVEWLPPSLVFRQLDVYYLKYHYVSTNKYSSLAAGEHELEIPVSWIGHVWIDEQGPQSQTFILANLSLDRIYTIQVSAATRSIVDTRKIYRGEPTVSVSITMESSSSGTLKVSQSEVEGLTTVEVIILSLFVVCFIIGILFCGFFYFFRKRIQSQDGSQKSPLKLSPTKTHPNLYVNGNCEALTGSKGALSQNIPASQLAEHIRKLYADGQIGLSKEYESMATLLQCSSDFQPSVQDALKPENRPRNRYVNVLAYDHSRVRLKQELPCCEEDDQEKCRVTCLGPSKEYPDYINANFVDGYEMQNAYILSQAPMTNTLTDFWQMIWDNNVRCVVMLTNIEETGRKKSEQYWPSLEQGTLTYGHFSITLISEAVSAFYIVRCLRVTKVPCKGRSESSKEEWDKKVDERHLIHYLYSDWPDHGRPDMTVPLLRFISKSSQSFDMEGAGPPIIHCSAGVGRSGCYIAVHSLMQQVDQSGQLNIFGYLYRARMQRMGLCQNESQYALIYDALLEYIESGQTEVYVDTFEEYFAGLLKDDMLLFKAQAVLLNPPNTPITFEYATKPFNQTKNRSTQFLPSDNYRHRVGLTPRPTVAGSDYINASYLPGYCHLRQFIITQIPMKSTEEAFWQMIWEGKIESIIMISPHSSADTSFAPFWPTKEKLIFEEFLVELTHSTEDQTSRSLTVQLSSKTASLSIEEESVFSCRILFSSLSKSTEEEVLSSLANMELLKRNTEKACGPIVVMDEFGGQHAALLCGLYYVKEQSAAERSIDLYLVARLFNEVRPGLFDSEQFLIFHKMVLAFCRAQRENSPVKTLYFSNSQLHSEAPHDQILLPKRLSAIVEEDPSVVSR